VIDPFKKGDRVWFRGHATRHIPAQYATVSGYRVSGDVHAVLDSGRQVSFGPNYFSPVTDRVTQLAARYSKSLGKLDD